MTAFVVEESRRSRIGVAKNPVTYLRSLLRFLHVRGRIDRELASCVPSPAGWRLAGLPKAIEPDQVERLLRSFDLASAVGRRDAAIVRLLLRLGLRAREVAARELDDLDWRAGEILVHGKGGREARLPLPRDVGRALAAYLRRSRPRGRCRSVFLRSRAPYPALTTGSVISLASRALRRAGIAAGGAHLLRHTAATQMLRGGASLPVRFAKHLHAFDPRHEVPPLDLLPFPKRRKTPYLYSAADVAALMHRARCLPHPLQSATYTTLIGLLTVTGMRVGEAIALDRHDVDWHRSLISIRDAKFKKSRDVPLHDTTLAALHAYARRRERLRPNH